MNEQDYETLMLFQGGSPASLTALQESVRRLVMSVISGRKCGASLERLNQDGSWERTCGDFCQVRMDGFSAVSSGTLPKWGMMSAGVLQALPQLEPYIDESEWQLLPTPTASIWAGTSKRRYVGSQDFHGANTIEALRTGEDDAQYINPDYVELIMGFPIKWTDLNV